MKQKRKILPKLFAALVVLTLISCCFLGTTFARYTSTGENLASVGVAEWDVTVTASGTAQTGGTVVAFDKLSPNVNTAGATNANLTNSTGREQVATLSVSAEVDAKITITLGGISVKDSSGTNVFESAVTMAAGNEYGIAANTQIEAADIAGVLTIKFYDAATAGNEIEFTAGDNGALTYTQEVKAGQTATTLNIYAEVTWTTLYEGAGDTGVDANLVGVANADKFDTWIGENVASVEWGLTYTVVQASQTPASGS